MNELELLNKIFYFNSKLWEPLLKFLVVKYPVSVRFTGLAWFLSFSSISTSFSLSNKGIFTFTTICFQLTSNSCLLFPCTELCALFITPQVGDIQAYSQINKKKFKTASEVSPILNILVVGWHQLTFICRSFVSQISKYMKGVHMNCVLKGVDE